MMHHTVKGIFGLAAACVIGAAPAAEATSAGRTTKASKSAAAQRGTVYFGATADGGETIVVSRNRRQVRRTLFAFKTTCSNGTTHYDYESFGRIPVAADRSFKADFDSGPQTSAALPGVTAQKTDSISGVINKRGSKIVGTERVTLTITMGAMSVKCDTGLVPFNATD